MKSFLVFLLVSSISIIGELRSATATPEIVDLTSGPYNLSIGGTLTLKVSAAATTTMTYQWQKDGVNIPSGGTAAVYNVPKLGATHAGVYRVVITTTAGSTTSPGITVTVNSGTEVPLSIVHRDPAKLAVHVGNTLTLRSYLTGDGPVSFQWFKDGAPISGATTPTYSVLRSEFSSAGFYHYRASSTLGVIDSPTTQVVIGEMPGLSSNPPARVVGMVGGSVTLTAQGINRDGTNVSSYGWTKDGGSVRNSNTPNLVLTNLTSTQAGVYRPRVFSGGYSFIGADSRLVVFPANVPGIKTVEGKYTYQQGENIILTASTLPATGTTFVWRRNGVIIQNSSSPTLSIPSASQAHAGFYEVTAATSAGSDRFSFPVKVLRPGTALTSADLALLINTNDPYSVEVGEYYRVKRNIPAGNIIRVNIPVKDMKRAEFAAFRSQVMALLPSNIQAIAVAWKLPHTVECNSFTGALSRGFDATPCDTAGTCSFGSLGSNPMYDSQSGRPFSDHGVRPSMLLAAPTVELAKAMIDRGIAADGTRPRAAAYVLKTSDNLRSLRGNNLAADLSLPLGYRDSSLIRTDFLPVDTLYSKSDVMFYHTGRQYVYNLDKNTYLPGAVADHLTSFGGRFTGSGQMSILEYMNYGFTGAFGTVSEPCAYQDKFPHPRIMVQRYGLGDTLIEAYWKSVRVTFQGNFIGEPLAAPYR